MTRTLLFSPWRVWRIGLILIALALLLSLPFVILLQRFEPFDLTPRVEKQAVIQPFSFSLDLHAKSLQLPIPNLEEEIAISISPPRPDAAPLEQVLVRFKKSADFKQVTLPCKMGVEFCGDVLRFSDNGSFWIELDRIDHQAVLGQWAIRFEEKVETGALQLIAEETPLQVAGDFPPHSPFRLLADAKWLGQDLLKPSTYERIEVGECLELDGWLQFIDGKWVKGKGQVIARLVNVSSKGLLLEGWDKEGYVRLLIPSLPVIPFKIKAEELFGSIRIRSEKQISCMLDKQCLVLKMGDWVLKANGKWKILRKKEEREALVHGKLSGELFIFEQILQKQGQKMIQGKIYNTGRSQVQSIEMAATTRKGAKR